MLSIVLISVALVIVIFAIANKKAEQPVVPTVEEKPLDNETTTVCTVVERELPTEKPAESIVEEKPKVKKKTSAKPKAPKKKKDA
jgi:hypothetical protein